ncbi:CvpA family protein [bacterium]|nr:CvpA family protein [bacterium]
MNWFDIFIVVVLFFFTWKGFRTGLVGAIGGFFGIIFGIWAGSHYMGQGAEWIMRVAEFNNEGLANILGFAAIFIAVNIAVGIIVSVVNRVFHIIPFIDLINKLLGAVVGLAGGCLAISALIYLMGLLTISDTVSDALISSQLAHWAMEMTFIIKPFIPAAIKSLQSII